jgi:hypothetical protein
MKDSRAGESLWSLWEGEGYVSELGSPIVYYTEGHVDVDHEVVGKALASAIQRDGVVYSLFEAYTLIDSGVSSQAWAGSFTGEMYQEVCDEEGLTSYGSLVDNLVPVTFVEVPNFV